jgi:hypothetical protein
MEGKKEVKTEHIKSMKEELERRQEKRKVGRKEDNGV